MRRANHARRDAAVTLFGIAALLAMLLGASMLPEFWRYIKIRSM